VTGQHFENQDIDRRLRTHGELWREANAHRGDLNWPAVVTQRRRRNWLAGLAVAVIAAAAVTVPMVITSDSGSRAAPIPGSSPRPSPALARRGAPSGFFAISVAPDPGSVPTATFVMGGIRYTNPSNNAVVALGVDSDLQAAYSASPKSECRTRLQRVVYLSHLNHGRLVSAGTVATIAGRALGQPMSVSPNNTKLALVLAPGGFGGPAQPYTCVPHSPNEIAVVNLRSGALRVWQGTSEISRIGSLEWSPDGQHLAFSSSLACASCHGLSNGNGTYVLNTSRPGTSLAAARQVVANPEPPTPIFWWHGRLVTPLFGALRLVLPGGGLGAVVARNFPLNVQTVSSDPSGNHLLLTGSAERSLYQGVLYRWDNGVLSAIDGVWPQPGW
jgi:hypothetical protein